jgi:hypothetical protein
VEFVAASEIAALLTNAKIATAEAGLLLGLIRCVVILELQFCHSHRFGERQPGY